MLTKLVFLWPWLLGCVFLTQILGLQRYKDITGLITQITLQILSRMTTYGTLCIIHILSSCCLWNLSVPLKCSYVPRLMLIPFPFSLEIFLKYVLTFLQRFCMWFVQLQHSSKKSIAVIPSTPCSQPPNCFAFGNTHIFSLPHPGHLSTQIFYFVANSVSLAFFFFQNKTKHRLFLLCNKHRHYVAM